MRRAVGLALAVSMLLAVAPAGPAWAHRQGTRASVDGEYTFPTKMEGSVSSPKGVCERGRMMKLIHIDGESGDRTAAGSDTTNRQGDYHITPSVEPVPGDDWLVRAIKKIFVNNERHRHFCKAARLRLAA